MEMRRGVLPPWRVVFWVVPLIVLVLSFGINACGGSDDDDCSATIEFATEAQCVAYGELYDCGDYDYENGVCSVFNCNICDSFDDDDDDDVF